MAKWVVGLAKLFVIFVLCVGVSMLLWRYQHREPSLQDIVLSCVCLPVMMLLMLIIRKRVMAMLNNKSQPSIPMDNLSTAIVNTHVVANAVIDERLVQHGLAGVTVYTQIATDVDDLLTQIERGEDTFELDAHLADDAGFPVITARVDSLKTEETRQQFEAWKMDTVDVSIQDGRSVSTLDVTMDKINWRVIGLLSVILDKLGDQISTYQPLISSETASDMHSVLFPMMRVVLNLGNLIEEPQESLSIDEEALLNAWLRECLAAWHWPMNRIQLELQIASSRQNESVWVKIMQGVNIQNFIDEPYLFCMVSIDSLLNEAAFGSYNHVDGWVPGEAGAGFFIIPNTLLKHFEQLHHTTIVMPILIELRPEHQLQTSVYKTMEECIAQWLALHELNHTKLGGVVYGGACTHQAFVDWMVFANANFEGVSDVINVSEWLGDIGVCGDMLALSVAHSQAQKVNQPILVVQKQADYFTFCLVKPVSVKVKA